MFTIGDIYDEAAVFAETIVAKSNRSLVIASESEAIEALLPQRKDAEVKH